MCILILNWFGVVLRVFCFVVIRILALGVMLKSLTSLVSLILHASIKYFELIISVVIIIIMLSCHLQSIMTNVGVVLKSGRGYPKNFLEPPLQKSWARA